MKLFCQLKKKKKNKKKLEFDENMKSVKIWYIMENILLACIQCQQFGRLIDIVYIAEKIV